MESRMEMFYIDSNGQARKTGVGAIMESNEETWRAFRSVRHLDVGHGKAEFLLDYYNRNGDLADTVAIRAADFSRITGKPVLSEAEYIEIDRKASETA